MPLDKILSLPLFFAKKRFDLTKFSFLRKAIEEWPNFSFQGPETLTRCVICSRHSIFILSEVFWGLIHSINLALAYCLRMNWVHGMIRTHRNSDDDFRTSSWKLQSLSSTTDFFSGPQSLSQTYSTYLLHDLWVQTIYKGEDITNWCNLWLAKLVLTKPGLNC